MTQSYKPPKPLVSKYNLDELSHVLKTINIHFADLAKAAEKLRPYGIESIADLKKCIAYATGVTYGRLIQRQTFKYQDASDEEIRKKLCVPLKESYEKCPNKLVLRSKSRLGANVIMHPLFREFYDIKENGSIILSAYRALGCIAVFDDVARVRDELYIVLDLNGIFWLFENYNEVTENPEKNEFRKNFGIDVYK
jgi:hypothetical protein